jgi:hypothetical protein
MAAKTIIKNSEFSNVLLSGYFFSTVSRSLSLFDYLRLEWCLWSALGPSSSVEGLGEFEDLNSTSGEGFRSLGPQLSSLIRFFLIPLPHKLIASPYFSQSCSPGSVLCEMPALWHTSAVG